MSSPKLMGRFLFFAVILLTLLQAGCPFPPVSSVPPVSSPPPGSSPPPVSSLPPVSNPAQDSGYVPRKAYDLEFSAAWEGALQALQETNMPMSMQDREKGILRTEYIKGPDLHRQEKALSTRYKYNLFFFRDSERRTIVNIRCQYETKEKIAPAFTNATDLYPDEVIALEKDLYQIIESRLLPLEASRRASLRGKETGSGAPRTETAGKPKVFLTTKRNANLRESPSDQSKVIMTLKPGRKVEKIGESGTYVHIRIWETTTGWIQKELLEETPP